MKCAYVIDDDEIFGECMKRFVLSAGVKEVRVFRNAIDAVHEMDKVVPDIMFLDVLLDGPDGFTLLNEMASYDDTAKVPVVIVSSLEVSREGLDDYGVVAVLNKATMTPKDVEESVNYVARSERDEQ